jgi:hypothetical protein
MRRTMQDDRGPCRTMQTPMVLMKIPCKIKGVELFQDDRTIEWLYIPFLSVGVFGFSFFLFLSSNGPEQRKKEIIIKN